VRRAIVLVVLAAVLAVVPGTARGTVSPRRVSTPSLPGALVWGNAVFTSRASFGHWLGDRHHSYGTWTRLHPRATAILVGAERGTVRFQPSQLAPGGPAVVEEPIAVPPQTSTFPFVPLLASLGLALVLLAALPFPVLAPRWAPGAVVYHNRLGFLAAGMVLVVAIVVAKLAA
jgi:hypothetical protein